VGGVQEAAPHQDELIWTDTRNRVYRKLVLEGERLVGAMAVQDPWTARRLTELLRTGEDIPSSLLDPAGASEDGEPDDETIVCSCNRKTRGVILHTIRSDGLSTVAEVARATSATTGCGSCTGEVEALIAGAPSGDGLDVPTQKLEPANVE
jgi:NAD(P)H-nitrite reductase large subunit